MPSIKWVDPERAHRFGVYLAARRLIPKERCKDDDVLVRRYALQDGLVLPSSQILNNLRAYIAPWLHPESSQPLTY